ncbi:MAG: beta-ketoacyl synthase N-terminal-like domain-containing protein [Gammaproteobacteria bacterium]
MGSKISVVGMACVYAGAGNLEQFWETVLTRRKGFRAIPPGRLRLDDYASEHRHERDKTYVKQAAVVDGYRFDWKTHRVPKSAFEATDPSHWLALSTALQAFDDSGADLDAIGRDRVGVILGNSLTGEVTRANMLRLRWPYVRQAIAAGARRSGMPDSDLSELLAEVEQNFKAPFPVPNEDTLAGALANVIAGRICNVLNLGGGGYTVDGACASSLLAVSAACEALEAGRLDMVLAGGVDISLDPLELVGFARTGALADGAMRVYDKNAGGFLPGEGCGLLVLMREPDMKRHGLKPWAHIAGWGISSDGAGGITAPKSDGQALAMRRCYRHAGFSPTELDFIEGHGTGTPVGDEQELNGFLAITEHEGGPSDLRRTGVTSVKTLVGHTKAAAGAAGLIKAVLGVNQRVLAPMAGPRDPAAAFEHSNARIYPIAKGNCLPRKSELKAGVAGAGFGGINCHVAVTGEDVAVRPLETRDADWLLASPQDAEVFVASADDNTGLAERLKALLGRSDGMAEGELVDLAADCAFRDTGAELRVAIVAGTVAELRSRFQALSDLLRTHTAEVLPAPLPPGCVLGRVKPGVRIGLLFPGQGSQFVGMGSILASRSDWAAARRTEWDSRFAELGPDGLSSFIDRPLERANGPEVRQGWTEALRDTAVAQPAIVMTGLQWLHWLRRLGVNFSAVLGHSLGEIGAMVAAQLLSEAEAMEVVRIRAGACADRQIPDGGMLALNCSIQTAESLAKDAGHLATIANDNAPEQAVLAGETQGLEKIAAIARSRGIRTTRLQVSKAFHTEHMAPAAEALNAFAGTRGEQRQAAVPFYSCVQGGPAPTVFDPFAYAAEQITAPVRFREAVRAMAETCDILVELGPGEVLTGLARKTLGDTYPVCALEPAAGDYDGRFCTAVGRLYVAGAALDWDAFYRERYWRPFVPAAERSFIENPCCSAETPFIPEPD